MQVETLMLAGSQCNNVQNKTIWVTVGTLHDPEDSWYSITGVQASGQYQGLAQLWKMSLLAGGFELTGTTK
jgi:hypothetical protein